MKRLVFIFGSLLLAVSAHAQMDIMVHNEMVGSSYGNFYSGSMITTWIPYFDGEKISETDFYKMTGDIRAEAAKKEQNTWFWSMLGGGCAMVLAGIMVNPATSDEAQGIVACSLIYGGGGAILGSLFFTGNIRPLPYAARLADSYNASH